MKKMVIVTLLVAALSASGLVVAGDQVGHKGFCKEDREKFCKNVTPGQGEVAKCLKSHEAELSPDCKAGMAEHREKMKARREACKADQEKFCKDVEPGKGGVHKCLKGHKAELSPDCAATFKR